MEKLFWTADIFFHIRTFQIYLQKAFLLVPSAWNFVVIPTHENRRNISKNLCKFFLKLEVFVYFQEFWDYFETPFKSNFSVFSSKRHPGLLVPSSWILLNFQLTKIIEICTKICIKRLETETFRNFRTFLGDFGVNEEIQKVLRIHIAWNMANLGKKTSFS